MTQAGQLATDSRLREDGSPNYNYTISAQGRISGVTKDEVDIAAYLYDYDEQRVVKTLSDGTVIHYHYDVEGRLISETDGATGEVIRDYIWLGLMPVAVLSASQDLNLSLIHI